MYATWLNARTSPIFVTGNKDVYNAVLPYIGQTVDGGDFTYAKDDNSPVPYALIASKYIESAGWNNASYSLSYMSYNANRTYTKSDTDLNALYYCFLAENGDADSYTLPAETLVGNKAKGVEGYFESYTEEHGGELINDRFSKGLCKHPVNIFFGEGSNAITVFICHTYPSTFPSQTARLSTRHGLPELCLP